MLIRVSVLKLIQLQIISANNQCYSRLYGTNKNTICMISYETLIIVLISVLVLVFQVVGILYLVAVLSIRTNIHISIIMSIHI